LEQVVSAVGVVFHCERRARVFERDFFRLGTAMGFSSVMPHGACGISVCAFR